MKKIVITGGSGRFGRIKETKQVLNYFFRPKVN